MSSYSDSTSHQTKAKKRSKPCGDRKSCSNWSGLNIVSMVFGFVFFWPIGLFLLFWILTGRNVADLPQTIHNKWTQFWGYWEGDGAVYASTPHGNNVFNEFQQTQFDRLDEIKREIKERSQRFRDFRVKARRRAEQQEFDEFMGESPTDSKE